MSDTNPTAPSPSDKPAKPSKPAKPYPEFPLTAHPAGVWCKKIRGQLFYFGPWDDPDGALRRYNEQKDDLHAGRTPATTTSTTASTIKEIGRAHV